MHNDHASLLRDLAGLVPIICTCGTATHASNKTRVVQSHQKPNDTWCLISYATLTPEALQAGKDRALCSDFEAFDTVLSEVLTDAEKYGDDQ